MILGVAAFMSLCTLAIQTGSMTVGGQFTATDNNGERCAFTQYGFPLKAVAAIEEPCAYSIGDHNKPSGYEVGYTYIDIMTVLDNFLSWGAVLLVVALLTRNIRRIFVMRSDN